MISDMDFVLQQIADTKQLRGEWEQFYYSMLDEIGHSGGSERENDALNEAQRQIENASVRIRRLEDLHGVMMTYSFVAELGCH